MADTHAIASQPVIPADGSFPYWTTVCGKRLQEKSLAVSSTKADITCAKCSTPRKAKA